MSRVDLVDGCLAELAMCDAMTGRGSQFSFNACYKAFADMISAIPDAELAERPIPMSYVFGMAFTMGALWAQVNPDRPLIVSVEVPDH
ncbi:MAG: hypothetical protein HRJ53_07795 [Acidobacteria bacterium Pan2503]|uniref:Uncharacterized protein n=1 Tax=Candidatus Acidiferrum panamense TaxID=2741543 RepID=A0A7V8NPE4_9BACT|nr:hypothetical protein [Candidatus Acidoferrum panamensis]